MSDMREHKVWPFVAEPNLFGESSEASGRERGKKGAHGGNMVSPVKPSAARAE
jgi:hypothetical protein